MRRGLLRGLLLTAVALNAAAQRVTLEVPLSPSFEGRAAPALYDNLVIASPATLSLSAPLLAAPLSQAAPAPLPAHAALPASALVAKPQAAAALPANGAQNPARVIDSLREHGDKAAKLSELKGEAGAAALESNFMSAASLGDGAPATPSEKGDATPVPVTPETRDLLARLKERVHIDDRGKADEKAALETAFTRLLQTPTGKRYAEEFIADGTLAHVHFADIPPSMQALAYAQTRPDGGVEIFLSRHYFLDAPARDLRQNLAGTIGHELLGHGLWLGRSIRDDILLAYVHHESDENHATLLGWNIEHELDGRFQNGGAWNYLADPAHSLKMQKILLPGYAKTFSQEQMNDPVGTLRERLSLAEKQVELARANLTAQKTWLPVLEYFSSGHGIPSERFATLRQELADMVREHEHGVAVAEAVRDEITAMIGRLEAEPHGESARYLQEAARRPLFARLNADVARLSASLRERVESSPMIPAHQPPPRPAGQISWDELAKMYHDDVAADASRPAGQKHWH